MLTRRKVYLSKVEAVKGTDSVPVVASDLILPNGDLAIAIPTEQDSGEGDLKGTYGPGDSVTTKQSMSIEITTRVRGLGQGLRLGFDLGLVVLLQRFLGFLERGFDLGLLVGRELVAMILQRFLH